MPDGELYAPVLPYWRQLNPLLTSLSISIDQPRLFLLKSGSGAGLKLLEGFDERHVGALFLRLCG
jgi:hypothetical protein